MSKVPLPGLAVLDKTSTMAQVKSLKDIKKNPFIAVGNWTSSLLNELDVVIGDPRETTSDFTRKKNPENRYWKAPIHFKYKETESKIIKMAGCSVPYIQATNYGSDFIVVQLQRVVADDIIKEALQKGILVNLADKRVSNYESETWWATVNNVSGKIGVADKEGKFQTVDLGHIITKTENGVRINLDLTFNLKLTKENKKDRTDKDVFQLAPELSRGAIMQINEEIEPPQVETGVPQQPLSKLDVASQELIDAIANL